MKTIAFTITSKCEENCKYCFKTPQKDTTIEEFKQMLQKAQKENPDLAKIVITGGNPELNEDFWEICKEVKDKKLKLKIHSTYFNPKTWEQYAKTADEVSIPIDSLGKQEFRSEKNHQNNLEALKYFRGKTKIQIHTVLKHDGEKELKTIKEFLDTTDFFQNNNWKIFKLAGTGELKKLEPTEEEWEKIKKKYKNEKTSFVDNVLEY